METIEIILGIIILSLILIMSRGTRRIIFLIIFALLVTAKMVGY